MFKYIRMFLVIALATSAITTTLTSSAYAGEGHRKGYMHRGD